MHPNPIFHTRTEDRNLAFARDRAFGILAVAPDGAPLLSHIPFLLNPEGDELHLHLVRSNPIVRALTERPLPARLAVSGPDGYISPDWYGIPDQVPTWNYVAVHIVGTLRLLPQDDMHDMLERQSAYFEARLAPKRPWTSDKMTEGVMDRMMRQIVPCAMSVESVDGTWKFSQNKSEDARLAAADQVETDGIGSDLGRLAAMMRDT